MIDNKRNFAKNTVAHKKRLEASRLAVTLSDDAAPSLQLQPIFLDLLTFSNDWACDRTVVLSQRPGCLRYLPKILCDNINYSQSQWRCSHIYFFHIYRARQFSTVSRVTSRNFWSKRWTWAIIQRHLKIHPWPDSTLHGCHTPKARMFALFSKRYGDIVWQH